MASKGLPSIFTFMHGHSARSWSRSTVCLWAVHHSVSDLKCLAFPFTLQCREIKRRSGSHDSGKLTTIRPKTVTGQQKFKYNRQRENRTKLEDQSHLDYFDDIDTAQDDFEELADEVSTYGNKFTGIEANDKFWRDATAFQRFIRAKTLERKYFKPPKKLNLLTWAAKEQIRCLHKNDPEEWTIEVLAKTFPVGKDSIQKIIKSKLKLRRLQHVLQNDLQVKRNWELILSHIRMNQLDSENVVKDFLDNLDSVGILQNVLSSTDLPYQKIEEINKKENGGIFSVIVRDELEKQEKENELGIVKQKQLDGQILEVVLEIRDILTEEVEVGKETMKSDRRSPQNSPESLKSLIKRRFQSACDDDIDKHNISSMGDDPLKQREAPRRVSLLNQENKHEAYSYRVDDCVYDENGEFLYRLP